MENLLTIIIPVYNTEKYLLRTFSSIQLSEVNVIIVNDGSTDNSRNIIDEYCSSHKNFTAIHIPHQGAAVARLTGLQHVKTKYFSFADSDDVINISNYVNLVKKMDEEDYKIGNGRLSVYLPGLNIPFNSRIWKKDHLNFRLDKREFSNTTCSFVDKIWHIDCAKYFMEESKQVVYEDMEFVYYVLASEGKMLHTNDLIYNYRMRGLLNNSTSAKGLQMIRSDGIKGLLSAATSMREKFKRDGLYQEYEEELNAIIIKLVYQRIFNILNNGKIANKKEMAELVFQALDSFVPNWRNNFYFNERFKNSEYNDYLFFWGVEFLKRINGVSPIVSSLDYETLLDQYDERLVLK